MTSNQNLEEIYVELNKLLKDVCNFLSSELNKGGLSATAKNEAEKLVSRSQKQVEIVSQISALHGNTIDDSYLQMGPRINNECSYVSPDIADVIVKEESEEIYAQVDAEIDTEQIIEFKIEEIDICPYSDLSLENMMNRATKHGILLRKERMFFFDKKRQYTVGLVDSWLLVYGANKNNMPCEAMNVMNYAAQEVLQKNDPTFEIVAPDQSKPLEFIARTTKDVEQWIVAINCKKFPKVPSSSLITSNNQISDEPDKNRNNINVVTLTVNDNDDGDIYQEVDYNSYPETTKINEEKNVITEVKSPKLPPRLPIKLFFNKEKKYPNNEYNNMQILKQEENEKKIEEDNDDQIYNSILNDDSNTKTDDDIEDNEEEIYDELIIKEKPSTGEVKVFLPITVKQVDTVQQSDIIQQFDKPNEDTEEEIYDAVDILSNGNNVELPSVANKHAKIDMSIKINFENSPPQKPLITSPKPKIPKNLIKKPSFSKNPKTKEDNIKVSTKIQSTIQQMEQKLKLNK